MTPDTKTTWIVGIRKGVNHFLNWPNNKCSYHKPPERRLCWRCGSVHRQHVYRESLCFVCMTLPRPPFVERRYCFDLNAAYISASKDRVRCKPLPPPEPEPRLKACDEMITAFMRDIEAVCRDHGLGFSHEATQGAFLVVDWEDDQLCYSDIINETGD